MRYKAAGDRWAGEAWQRSWPPDQGPLLLWLGAQPALGCGCLHLPAGEGLLVSPEAFCAVSTAASESDQGKLVHVVFLSSALV